MATRLQKKVNGLGVSGEKVFKKIFMRKFSFFENICHTYFTLESTQPI